MQTTLIQPYDLLPPSIMTGLIPRDRMLHPQGYLGALAPPFPRELELLESEIQVRLDELMHAQATLPDIRLKAGPNGGPIPSRDQDGYGYCWCHSSVSAMLLKRAAQNEPYVDLSAFAIGCIVKNYRNQGGWGSQSMEFLAERGCPTSEFWPQQSTKRSNDNPATWENAKLHQALRWYDLDDDRMWLQQASCMARNWPTVNDYNWWSHSVCGARMKDYKGRVLTIWNSWSDSWKDQGMGDLEGGRAVCSDCWALVTGEPSPA